MSAIEDEVFSEIAKDPLLAKRLFVLYNLQIPAPDQTPRLLKNVKEVVHKAFWDIIDESSDKPNNENIINLLSSAKKILLGLAGTKNSRILAEIENVLNTEHVSRELGNGDANINNRILLVVDIMSKICSPARDEEVKALKCTHSPTVSFLRELFKVLENMRLDMSNFLFKYYRQEIINNCISFEKTVFSNYLKNNSRLARTRKWIGEAITSVSSRELVDTNSDKGNFIVDKSFVRDVLDVAFTSLLSLPESEYPETFNLDHVILRYLNGVYHTSIFVVSILNILKKCTSQILPHDERIENKITEIVLNCYDLEKRFKTESTEIIHDMGKSLIEFLDSQRLNYGIEPFKNTFKEYFVSELTMLFGMKDPVWILFEKRVKDAIFQINDSPSRKTAVHFSLIKIQDSIGHIRDILSRLIKFNLAVYEDHYYEMVETIVRTENCS